MTDEIPEDELVPETDVPIEDERGVKIGPVTVDVESDFKSEAVVTVEGKF
jgi:hypothetical protein